MLTYFPMHIMIPFFRLQFLSAFFDGIRGFIVGVIVIIAIQILGKTVGSKGRIKPTTIDGVLVVASHDAIAALLGTFCDVYVHAQVYLDPAHSVWCAGRSVPFCLGIPGIIRCI